MYPVRIEGLNAHISIGTHQAGKQPDRSVLLYQQRLSAASHGFFIGVHDLVRQCIDQLAVFLIPVEPLIDCLVNPVDRQINLAVYISALHALFPFTVQKNRGLIPAGLIPFTLIHLLF